MDKKLRSRVSRRKRYKPLPSPCPSKGAYQDRVLWLCIPVEGPYYLGSASLGGKYESDLIVGKGTLSAWYRAVWVLVPAVTEFSGNASCSAPAGLGLLEVAAPLQRRMCREGKKPSGQSGQVDKLALGAALCPGRIGSLFPAGPVPWKPSVRFWGHFQTILALASHFVTVKAVPLPGPPFSFLLE